MSSRSRDHRRSLLPSTQRLEHVQAGVTCLKIEGRLKGPEYVALTTQVYRAAVDRAWAAVSSGQPSSSATRAQDNQLQALQQVFSRGQDEAFTGLTPGFLEGSRHQRLVRGNNPRHRGVCLGRWAPSTLSLHLPG